MGPRQLAVAVHQAQAHAQLAQRVAKGGLHAPAIDERHRHQPHHQARLIGLVGFHRGLGTRRDAGDGGRHEHHEEGDGEIDQPGAHAAQNERHVAPKQHGAGRRRARRLVVGRTEVARIRLRGPGARRIAGVAVAGPRHRTSAVRGARRTPPDAEQWLMRRSIAPRSTIA